MNRYDEILQIFESQKLEILKLSDKVNELEETNAFLMTVLEKSKTLPPVYDPNLLRKDKAAAIQKEYSLNTIRRNNSHIDSTHCETTLNDSLDLITNNNPNSLRWSSDSLVNKKIISSTTKSESINLKKLKNSSTADEIINNSSDKKSHQSLTKHENNLNLRISNSSPIRSQFLKPAVLCNNDKIHLSNEYSSDNKTSNSEDETDHEQDFLDSVIIKSVDDLINEVENLPISKTNANFSICQKSNGSPSPSKSLNQSSSLTSTMIPRTTEKENIQVLLDNLIDTLQTTNKAYSSHESYDNLKSSNNSESIYSEYMNKLITQKNQYVSNINDKHAQMKLLMTAQQLQADLLHQSLEENSKILFKDCRNVTQNNPSNSSLHPVEKDTKAHINEILQIDLKKVPVSSVDVKLYRQKELSRINSKINCQILESPKIKNGFVKFTALVKGYIVRTLRETDKVQNIIITIKDTAQLAIKLRQERLSGDSSLIDDPNTYNSVSRRNNHEIISFQQRLVSQLKTALGELHEIFFEWPSSLKMRLIRHHINQLMSSTSNNLQTDYEDGNSIPATENYTSPREAKLSSATLKRRQKLALRSGNNNKESGIKNSISSASHRKPIYSSPYGCRGYGSGTNSRSTNVQSKITNDRKSRTNTISRRRGATRTITKFDINKITESPKSNPGSITNQPVKTSKSEVPTIQTVSNKSEEISDNQPHQQQSQSKSLTSIKHSQMQENSHSKCNIQSQPSSKSHVPKHFQNWIQPKTITTSICSPNSNNFVPFAKNLQKHLFIVRNQNPTNESKADGDSFEISPNHNKISTTGLSSNSGYTEGNINKYSEECDWKTQTYTLSTNITVTDDNFKHDISSPGIQTNKFSYNDDTSNRSCLSDFNEKSVSRVEVDVNDMDIGYLCRNNSSYYSEYNDPTESQSVVFVDVISKNHSTETDMHQNSRKPIIESPNSNSSNKSNKRNFSFQKHIKPNANNVVISNALNSSKPEFYFPTNTNGDILPVSSQFRIRKRIVAANSLHSSTVSHS